jgi:hypothetical protein
VTYIINNEPQSLEANNGPVMGFEDADETWNYRSAFTYRAGCGRVFHREQVGDPS